MVHHAVITMQVGAADPAVSDLNLDLSGSRRRRNTFTGANGPRAFVVRCFHIPVTVSLIKEGAWLPAGPLYDILDFERHLPAATGWTDYAGPRVESRSISLGARMIFRGGSGTLDSIALRASLAALPPISSLDWSIVESGTRN